MTGTTVFHHARLVGYPDDKLYTVKVVGGIVSSIDEEKDGQYVNGYDGTEANVIDLRGQEWLSPSLIDWHVHTKLAALHSNRLNLQDCTSAAQVIDEVKKALKDPKYDASLERNLVGINMRNSSWPDEKILNLKVLDELSSNRPMLLLYNGYHSMWCNSAALSAAGYDPAQHTGYLEEQEAFDMFPRLTTADDDVVDHWILQQAKKAASMGVTEIVDLEMEHNIVQWQRRYAAGNNYLRIHVGMYTEHIQDAIDLGLTSGDDVPNTDGLIKVGPYKIVTDGSLGSQTAFCHDAYPGTKDNFGVYYYQPSTLAQMLEKGLEHNFRFAIHAIGDHANHLTLKTISQASSKLRQGSTIEHAQMLNLEEDLELFRDLGLIASIQPAHLVDDRDLCHKFWPGREHKAYAFKSIVGAGIPIKLGSDAPIAPMNPWEALAVSITRAGENDESNPFIKDEILDLETAWKASTSNEKSKLEAGDRADLCILPADPLKQNAAGLRGMRVKGTMLGGRWTHKAF
ncbi:uncharacterized protein I303_101817 [Kwoniella dejecticola CBS 10117]|uniref:Amidohydrolase 3 domain-containing protein n=1 Tax=Kwoniella dejecticola CBS 10117 TaxID=1296121 RepID=A0A1A6ACR2_9TREE|nr:uncharacterized protein I303_02047 [Kwoniella dejecticola CBS 10117]OBR87833.1 hypothetical protein I303_02047 [Kwoniella dejecticola CBS 10117]